MTRYQENLAANLINNMGLSENEARTVASGQQSGNMVRDEIAATRSVVEARKAA